MRFLEVKVDAKVYQVEGPVAASVISRLNSKNLFLVFEPDTVILRMIGTRIGLIKV